MLCSGLVHRVFSALHVLTAVLVALGVFVGLPQRWLPVDLFALLVVMSSLFAAWSVRRADFDRWTRVVCAAQLVVGGAVLIALASGAAFLAGIYGPLGRGGMLIFILVMALVAPYLCAVPTAELVWLRRRSR